MAISTTTSSITYQGNGATTVFTFPFVGDSSMTLEVLYTDASGIVTTLNPSVYTLVINAVPSGGLWGIGGSVTYPITPNPVVPITTGTYLTINRTVPYEQTIEISNQGAFYPQVVEQGLDLLELQIQQIDTDAEYAIRCPITDLVPPNVLPIAKLRANGYLGFDANGQPIIIGNPGGGSPFPPSGNIETRRIIVSGTSTIDILNSDAFGGVSIYQTGTPATTLQLPTYGGPYPIFDGGLNASTYPITILPPAGFTILGKSSFAINYNGQSISCYNDGYQIIIG